MSRTPERRSDSRHVINECLLNVDEVDRSLTPHIAIPDQIAKQPCMIRRNRRTVAESIEAPWLRHPVSLAEFPGLTPAVLRQHLVIGCRPHGCATGDPQPDNILNAMCRTGDWIEDPSALCEALVLDDLGPGAVAHCVGAVLERLNSPDV